MPMSEANYERIRKAQQRIAERRAARSLESGQAERSGTGRDIANGQSDRDQVDSVGPVQNPSGFSRGDRDGVQIPAATPTRPQQVDHLRANGYTDEPHYVNAAKEVWDGTPPELSPKWAKPNRLVGWIAKRTGKWLRPKEKKEMNVPKPDDSTTPPEAIQAQKFNLTTNQVKGIVSAVAMITAVAGGLLGKQVLIDETTITTAIHNLYAAYMGVLAVVGAVAYVLRIVKNINSNWTRIKQHGVKVSGPNADLSFDFAPKDGE